MPFRPNHKLRDRFFAKILNRRVLLYLHRHPVGNWIPQVADRCHLNYERTQQILERAAQLGLTDFFPGHGWRLKIAGRRIVKEHLEELKQRQEVRSDESHFELIPSS